jgi:hypothetical protein
MRAWVGSLTISRLAAAVAAVWLCGAGSAWAGGGGADGGIVQPFLNGLCQFLGMTNMAPSCPQLPRATQVILEYAALATAPPDFVRGPVGAIPTCSVAGDAGNPCANNALNAVNRPVPAPIGLSDLANLTPLAFTINKQGQAIPTEPGDPSAVSFLYAVTTTTGVNEQPDTLQLFYDYPPLTSSTFPSGNVVAQISLPLQVLSMTNGSERLVCGPQGCPLSVATLQITACGASCLSANVFGNFSQTTPMLTAAALGIQSTVVFGSSPNSSKTHAIFEVQVPLLVTGPTSPAQCGKAIAAGTPDPADCGNDPAYFGVTPANATNGIATGSPTGINQITGLPTAFSTNDLGHTPAALGAPVGIAPSAAPACPGGKACPVTVPPALPPPSTFPFCASFSVKGVLNPAVAVFYAIGTDGAAYLSAPIVPPTNVACPF